MLEKASATSSERRFGFRVSPRRLSPRNSLLSDLQTVRYRHIAATEAHEPNIAAQNSHHYGSFKKLHQSGIRSKTLSLLSNMAGTTEDGAGGNVSTRTLTGALVFALAAAIACAVGVGVGVGNTNNANKKSEVSPPVDVMTTPTTSASPSSGPSIVPSSLPSLYPSQLPSDIPSQKSRPSSSLAPSGIPREELIAAQLLASFGDVVLESGSPYNRSAEWLISEDAYQVDAEDEAAVEQRFLVALFYFDTTDNGEKPWLACNPPAEGEDDSCFYQDLNLTRFLSPVYECSFAGIFCDFFGDVAVIDLTSNGIQGTLPTELAFFPWLTDIVLFGNLFTGTLPEEYAATPTGLKSLSVHFNELTGTIPESYYNITSMLLLNVGANIFTGTISTQIGLLSNMLGFFTFDNFLTGTLPSEMGELAALTFTRHQRNDFVGLIPTELGNLAACREFWAHDNMLTGTLPTEIGNMAVMESLRFNQNAISGTIPTELGKLSVMDSLRLYNNTMTGTIPDGLSSALQLTILYMNYNMLEGAIPDSLADLERLQRLRLQGNMLTGSAPEGVCNLFGLFQFETDCAGDEPEVICPCCTDCF
jgi:Leucine-rich repeat (LRR) protein